VLLFHFFAVISEIGELGFSFIYFAVVSKTLKLFSIFFDNLLGEFCFLFIYFAVISKTLKLFFIVGGRFYEPASCGCFLVLKKSFIFTETNLAVQSSSQTLVHTVDTKQNIYKCIIVSTILSWHILYSVFCILYSVFCIRNG
jgi:hypothetical protein